MADLLKQRVKQSAEFESPALEALLNLLIAADHMRRKMEQLCADHGITPTQYNVLRILRGAAPHGLCRSEISERMVERAPDVTRLIDRLEDAGLVVRTTSPNDRRLSLSCITEKGVTLLQDIEPANRELNRYFAARVSERDIAHLSRICQGIYADDV